MRCLAAVLMGSLKPPSGLRRRWSLALLLLSSAAFGTTLERLTVQRGSLSAVRDCYLWEEDPDSNHNSDTLYVGLVGVSDKISLLRFDVSSIPADATIVEARLIMYASDSAGVELEVHPITADWVETAPTWNNFLANVSPNVKARFTPVVGRNVVDVTIPVMGWVSSGQNFGLALSQATRTPSTTFFSSDAAEVPLRPALEVLFTRAQPIVQSPVPPLFASCGVPFRYQLRAHTPAASGYEFSGAGPALDAATGELTWTPVESERGAHSFTVKVTQGTRTEELPLEVTISCTRALDVGFGCSSTGLAPGLVLFGFLLRRRQRGR